MGDRIRPNPDWPRVTKSLLSGTHNLLLLSGLSSALRRERPAQAEGAAHETDVAESLRVVPQLITRFRVDFLSKESQRACMFQDPKQEFLSLPQLS